MIPESVPISRRLAMDGDRSLVAVFHLRVHTHTHLGGRALRGLWAFLMTIYLGFPFSLSLSFFPLFFLLFAARVLLSFFSFSPPPPFIGFPFSVFLPPLDHLNPWA